MWLRDTDLSSVLLEHLTSLTSLVTGSVYIWNLRGCDPASLLASVRCEALWVQNTLTIPFCLFENLGHDLTFT